MAVALDRLPVSWPVGVKFAAAVGAVVLGMLTVTVIGTNGLTQLRANIERLTSDDLAGLRTVDDLTIGLSATKESSLAELAATGPVQAAATASLDQVLVPRLSEQVLAVRQSYAHDTWATPHLTQQRTNLDEYLAQRRSNAATPTGPDTRTAQIAHVRAVFDRLTNAVGAVRDGEYADTAASVEQAHSTYSSTLSQLIIGAAVSLLVALTVVMLLVRNMAPRLRAYARFAGEIAAGREVGSLNPRGGDELAQLARALDEMVGRTAAARRREADQVEFTDTLQVTATEEEAHELVQRHLQRSLPGSTVVVLRRNNSENRLEAATA